MFSTCSSNLSLSLFAFSSLLRLSLFFRFFMAKTKTYLPGCLFVPSFMCCAFYICFPAVNCSHQAVANSTVETSSEFTKTLGEVAEVKCQTGFTFSLLTANDTKRWLLCRANGTFNDTLSQSCQSESMISEMCVPSFWVGGFPNSARRCQSNHGNCLSLAAISPEICYPGQKKKEPSPRFAARRTLFHHVISCSTMHYQRRSKVADSCG